MIQKQILIELRQEFGEAFYLLDSINFRNNFCELKKAFSSIYGNFNIAYSYKTNYIPKLCKIVDELGGYAEVVSEMELELALKCGVNPNRIIWNGPIKTDEKLKEYLLMGVTINVDSLYELEQVSVIARENKHIVFNVGIRCNFDVGDGVISRFGFDVEGEDFKKALGIFAESKGLCLKNFQCHFAKRQIEYWSRRVTGMLGVLEETGVIPERIDIGGGLFGKMPETLQKQLGTKIPTYSDYAMTVMPFAEFFSNKENQPELLIEPGSALVGDCMKFVGTIKSIKSIRGKTYATVLGSQKNISMTGVNPPMEIVHINEGRWYDNLDLVGYTCIEGDVLFKGYTGKLAEDDMVILSNCGSYSIVMKPPFILPNFPVIEIANGKTELIKRKEVFGDIFSTYGYF